MSGKAELTFLILTGIFMWAMYELYREFLERVATQPIIATSAPTEEEKAK